MAKNDDAARYRANLQGEYDSAGLYRALADAEPDPRLKEVYGRLAAVEEGHAEFWRRQLDRIGARAQHLGLGWRTRALAWLARRFGPQLVLPTVNTLEQRDVGQYDDQAEAVAHGLPAAERSHARIVRAIEAEPPGGLPGNALARLEGRHRALGGNALRAAVLGANDGLVSNLSLVMGVAGANAAEKTILLTGLAGLAAGACSMAMGEWLSVNSSRELAQRQIDIEAAELEQSPEEEIEEITLIYRGQGPGAAAGRGAGPPDDEQQTDRARHAGPRGAGDRSAKNSAARPGPRRSPRFCFFLSARYFRCCRFSS